MKKNYVQHGVWLFIASCLMLALMPGCTSDKPGSDAQAITCPDNIKVSESGTAPPYQHSKTIWTLKTRKAVTVYTDNGCNCHAWAWSVAYGFPTSIPDYALDSPSYMYEDGSYRKIATSTIYDPIPANVDKGDKVVYSNDDGAETHSAIVEYQYNKGVFRSYVVGVGVVSKTPDGFAADPIHRFGKNLTYYRIGQSSYRTGLSARKIAIQATYNGKYVCADFFGGGDPNVLCKYPPLFSNRSAIGEWETFDLIDLGGGKAALWSYASGEFVSFHYSPYRAWTGVSEISEDSGSKFTLENSNGGYYFKWGYPGRTAYYVHYDSFEAGCQSKGAGSRFNIIYLN